MRTYVVQAGDSPASIASRPDMAGCPKCSVDLIDSNKHKPTVTMPNGYVTFKDLREGETLHLPDKWFTKEFDALPPSYFARLPHPDGLTAGVGESFGLGDGFLGATFSAALITSAQAAVAAMHADPNYCVSVHSPGSPVNSAVHAFKSAWNASQSPTVPINTGNYESPVAAALAQVLGSAPAACDVPKAMTPAPTQAVAKQPMSTGAVVGVGLLVAGAVGGAAYLAMHHPPTRRRVHRISRRFGR